MKYIRPLLLGLLLLNGLMFLLQPSMIFFPFERLEQTPTDWGLGYENVTLKTQDGVQLHGWYIPHKNSEQTLLFFHGNAGNISHRGDSVKIFHQLGLNVFIIDYRGYGNSEGKANEDGLYKDARAAWLYLRENRALRQQDIIIFGRSLGGAVAAKLAAEVQPAGLILESTFSSARDIANTVFPVLSRLIFLRYDFNTINHIEQVKSPVLVLHSPDDKIVAFRFGKKIFQTANEPKTFVTLRGDHNSGFLMSQPEYARAISAFTQSLIPQGISQTTSK